MIIARLKSVFVSFTISNKHIDENDVGLKAGDSIAGDECSSSDDQ